MGVMKHKNIRYSQIGVEKKQNCKFNTLQVLSLHQLLPSFVVKNASRYSNSSLSKLFKWNILYFVQETIKLLADLSNVISFSQTLRNKYI